MFNSKKPAAAGQIDTLIGEQCHLQGNLKSQNSIRIEGRIIGNVACEGMVVVGEKGRIEGNIEAKDLLVYGRIEGDITAGNLDLKTTAHISGNIDTHTLQVEPGAVYQGSVTMKNQQTAPAADKKHTAKKES